MSQGMPSPLNALDFVDAKASKAGVMGQGGIRQKREPGSNSLVKNTPSTLIPIPEREPATHLDRPKRMTVRAGKPSTS